MSGEIPASASESGASVIYSGNTFPLSQNPDLSTTSSLFITDPTRSVDFPSGIPDDLEFDNSSASELYSPNLAPESPLVPKSPIEFSINSDIHKKTNHQYSPFESPPRASDSLSDKEEETDYQDLSFINDTRAQFDLDIHIDESKVVNGEPKLSPWRKFSTNQSLRHSSLLNNRITTQNSIVETSSAKKLEEVTKQLTNCKIQLKLYEKFLQDLIDRQQIDIGELSELNGNFTQKSISNLEQEHADMCALVEDLYASLEEFQGKWRDADKRVFELDHKMHDLALEASNLLSSIGEDMTTDPKQDPQLFLESALLVMKDKIANLIQDVNDKHDKIIQDMQTEYESFKKDNHSAEKMLREQLLEIAKWKKDYGDLERKYDDMKSQAADADFQKLQTENDRLSSLNKVVDDKLQKYQTMIDQLQKEVNDFKNLSRKSSLSDVSDISVYPSLRERERYILLQRDFENLQRLHENMADEFERFKETSSSTIATLNNQLNNRKRDILSLRAEHTDLDNLQHDLNTSIEKQRLLTSEKMKLAWQVEMLTKDKEDLQSAFDRLSAKSAGPGESTISNQLLDGVKGQLEALFRRDVWEFQRLYKSFNKIADDASLVDPKRRINALAQAVIEKSYVGNLTESSTLKEHHKAVFDYFARAVETIVNDHIRLLLKESDGDNKDSSPQVKKLEKKIAALEDQLEQKQPVGSPRLNMRIEELTNRWKVEREARVHDNEQAKKRLQQLEEENERLRASR